MNKNLITTSVFLALLIFFGGCTSSRRTISFNNPDPGYISEVIDIYNELERFDADFSVKVKVSVMGGSATGHIQYEGNERLKIEYKGPLSAFSGDLIVSDGFYELKQSDGKVSVDSLKNLNLADLSGIPFPSSDLNVLFKPYPSIIDIDVYTRDFYVEEHGDSLWIWETVYNELNRTIVFDPISKHVIEEFWTDSRNRRVLTKVYDGFVNLKGHSFARKIKVNAKGRIPVEYTLTYDQVRVNPKWKRNPFVFLTVK